MSRTDNLFSFVAGVGAGAAFVGIAAFTTAIALAVGVTSAISAGQIGIAVAGVAVVAEYVKIAHQIKHLSYLAGLLATVGGLVLLVTNSDEPQANHNLTFIPDDNTVQMVEAPDNTAKPLTSLGTSFTIADNSDVIELSDNAVSTASLYEFKPA